MVSRVNFPQNAIKITEKEYIDSVHNLNRGFTENLYIPCSPNDQRIFSIFEIDRVTKEAFNRAGNDVKVLIDLTLHTSSHGEGVGCGRYTFYDKKTNNWLRGYGFFKFSTCNHNYRIERTFRFGEDSFEVELVCDNCGDVVYKDWS